MVKQHSDQSPIQPIDEVRIKFINQTKCANCHSREIRKIGKNRYFCPVCFTEFVVLDKRVSVYTITEDGGLKKIG